MPRNRLIYYSMPLIVLLLALLQSTVATQVMIRGVKPDLVLIVIVVATLVYGGQGGLLWAFIGGIGLDLFSGGPFGASSIALMMATLVAALGYRVLSRYHLFVPLGAAALGTLIYSLVYLG
ncbi:MAG: rod shape-determining protein MreD, partial [Caldilineaceae bacterium]|nr:rod shape-determining protein MreD [Caldilineaceae bacterium]